MKEYLYQLASIVEEIRKDREKGAKLLENEYKAGLMSLARRFCADESDAEELVNRTFAIVIERIDSYLEQSAFFGWMSRILVNCYSKDVRRKSNEMEFCDAELPEDAQDEDASARVFREVDASILRDAIDRLPKDMKQTLLMHYFMDMPVREVAKVLSVPSGTIMWRLHYARKILGAKLGASLKKPVVALVAAALFLMAGVAAVVGVVAEMTQDGSDGALGITRPTDADVGRSYPPIETSGESGALGITRPANDDDQSMTTSTQKEETTMQTTSIGGLFRKALRSLAAIATTATMASAPAVASTAEWTGEGANALNSASYMKVMENTGPLAGTWTLTGITAWNGAAQVAFACVSNRPYAAAYSASAQGALPAGNYVHQLSVFNQWDGSRTRSYRVQLAQPVGGNDIYARVTAVTVSQEDFKDDATKIAASYTANADLANFPVTKLKFKKQSGYLESEGDAFISLGHCAGPNTRIEVDLELTEIKLGTMPFGSYGENTPANGNPLFELFISYSSNEDQRPKYSWEFSDAGFVRRSMNCDLADRDRHVIAFDAPAMTYTSRKNGEFVSTYTFENMQLLAKTSSVPMSVFGRGIKKYAIAAADFGGATKMKVYGVNIYESGKLVKCFVPRLSSGIPGLRDIINNAFVTGIDVSKVKYGGDIMEKDDVHIDLESEIREYGYGNGICIDTGYTVGPATRVELDYALLTGWSSSSKWSCNPCLFAANGMDLWVYGTSDGRYAYSLSSNQYYGDNRGEITNMTAATAFGIRRTAAMNSNSVWFVTAGYTNAVGTGKAITGNLSHTLKIGARYDRIRYLPIRVYGLRIYEDNVLARNYVPVVTNGIPGLVDTKQGGVVKPITLVNSSNNNSKTNRIAVACGNFDAHTTAVEREAYLEFPETGSGIDTGYSVGRNSCIEGDFSLWMAGGMRQELFDQDSGTDSSFFSITSAGSPWRWWFKFADETGTDWVIDTVNDRRQFIADRHAGTLTIKEGDAALKTVTMAGSNTRAGGGAKTVKIGRLNAAMRLYSFKIYEYVNDVKTPVRDFVPCVTNGVAGLYEKYTKTFLPLTGGKVSGKSAAGADEFVTRPQSTKIEVSGNGTLTCFSAAAKSYEWFVDGEKIDGETGETLTIDWDRQKPHVRTYSVVPVYEVFGETVRGKAAETMVEFKTNGMTVIIR